MENTFPQELTTFSLLVKERNLKFHSQMIMVYIWLLLKRNKPKSIMKNNKNNDIFKV